MFPLLLKLAGRRCLVVGGGAVGRRKAKMLLHAGADVRLVCLEPPQPLDALKPPEWLQQPYVLEHLAGMSLAFAAATPDVNRQVAADARARGIWVNVADDPEAGDFYLPATLRRGDFVLTVGTGGAAPGLAKMVRDRLEHQFDEAFGEWVSLLAELRPAILQVADMDRRQALFAKLTEWRWLERLRNEGVAAVRQAMMRELSADGE